MQLTYRGIKYKTSLTEKDTGNNPAVNKDFLAHSYNRIAKREICYYTYRGVSYIKYPVLSAKPTNKIL